MFIVVLLPPLNCLILNASYIIPAHFSARDINLLFSIELAPLRGMLHLLEAELLTCETAGIADRNRNRNRYVCKYSSSTILQHYYHHSFWQPFYAKLGQPISCDSFKSSFFIVISEVLFANRQWKAELLAHGVVPAELKLFSRKVVDLEEIALYSTS